MKIISFFSEKGGVGKSSFTIMYASWLCYKYGVKVAIADFNDRLSDYRRAEIRERNKLIKEHPGQYPPLDEAKAWPIYKPKLSEINKMLAKGDTFPYATWFDNTFLRNKDNQFDVVLCDFPGGLSGGEFIQILTSHFINLVVIPIEKEEQTIQSTFKLHDSLDGFNHVVFINKANLGLRNIRSLYINFGRILTKNGLPMLPDMVSSSDKMQAIDKVAIIRSTFAYPDFDSPAFMNARDLGIENLFLDVTRELAKCKDIQLTAKTDLSFIDDIQKRQDGRMFTGSAFPEYENK